MENVRHVIGADLSKRKIDLVIHSIKKHICIDNQRDGFKHMISWLNQNRIKSSEILIVMEHTGLYGFCFEHFLHKKQIPFCKVSALDIKLSIGVSRGKSDKIDAARIARYGADKLHHLKVQTQTSKALERLKLLNTSRDKLVRTRASLKTSAEEFRNIGMGERDLALRSQLQVIRSLDNQIQSLEKEIEAVIRKEKELETNYDLLKSIKGVGPVLATNTIIKTQNFERFPNSRKFACFCGIAPFEHTSGSSIRNKTRVNHLADKEMKTLLDLAAKSAITCDPELKAYYQNRIANGKSKMSTINIVRNKIVGRIFAVIKRQSPYSIDYLRADLN
jgi:transposase